MADNFNMKQFLFENKLGAYSKLKENKVTIGNYNYEETGAEKDIKEEEILRSGYPSSDYEIDGEMQKGSPKSVKPGLIFFLRIRGGGGMSRTSRQEEDISVPYIVKSDNGDGTWKCEKLKEIKSETKKKESTNIEEALPLRYLQISNMERMDGLVPQTALKALIKSTQAIIRNFKTEGFEDDEIFDYIMSKIKTLG